MSTEITTPTLAPRQVRKALSRPSGLRLTPARSFLLFALLHVILAYITIGNATLSRAHLLAVVVGGAFACAWSRSAELPLILAGYIVASEVFWRMTRGAIFWEVCKYAAIVFLVIALARLRRGRPATTIAASLFFLLLLPSIPLTVNALSGIVDIRRSLSFYLAGPLCLAVAAAAFSRVRPADYSPIRALQWISYPIIGTASVTLLSTTRAAEITFLNESNMVTSGHFGPNQVSGILGFGALALFAITLLSKDRMLRLVTTVGALWLTSQAILTLSRGGVLSAGMAALALALHALPNRRARLGLLFAGVVAGALMAWVVLPRLNQFTSGSLQERYSVLDTSGRTEVAEADIWLWGDNLILGVGPGMSPRLRNARFGAAAHTEFTRLLAEHGLLGALAIALLITMAIRAYLLAPNVLAKGFVAACMVWSMSEMTHSAMRLAVTAFAFGLGMIGVDRRRESHSPQDPDSRNQHARPTPPE